MSSEKFPPSVSAPDARAPSTPSARVRRIQVEETPAQDRPSTGSIALSFAVVRRNIGSSAK